MQKWGTALLMVGGFSLAAGITLFASEADAVWAGWAVDLTLIVAGALLVLVGLGFLFGSRDKRAPAHPAGSPNLSASPGAQQANVDGHANVVTLQAPMAATTGRASFELDKDTPGNPQCFLVEGRLTLR